jgi:hypothetical protein
MVERSFEESSSQIRAEKEEIRKTWEYASSVACKSD